MWWPCYWEVLEVKTSWSLWASFGYNYVVSRVLLGGLRASRLSSHLAWQKHQRWTLHTHKMFNQIFFHLPYLLAPLTSTILYHFHWFWSCLGVTRSAQSKTYGHHFLPNFFIWSGWNLMWWLCNVSLTSWDYFWVRFIETREITAVYQTASKNFNIGMHSDVYEWIWFN